MIVGSKIAIVYSTVYFSIKFMILQVTDLYTCLRAPHMYVMSSKGMQGVRVRLPAQARAGVAVTRLLHRSKESFRLACLSYHVFREVNSREFNHLFDVRAVSPQPSCNCRHLPRRQGDRMRHLTKRQQSKLFHLPPILPSSSPACIGQPCLV